MWTCTRALLPEDKDDADCMSACSEESLCQASPPRHAGQPVFAAPGASVMAVLRKEKPIKEERLNPPLRRCSRRQIRMQPLIPPLGFNPFVLLEPGSPDVFHLYIMACWRGRKGSRICCITQHRPEAGAGAQLNKYSSPHRDPLVSLVCVRSPLPSALFNKGASHVLADSCQQALTHLR